MLWITFAGGRCAIIVRNRSGWELLEYIDIAEKDVGRYENVTGSYAIIRVNGLLLICYNRYRRQWELPAGGIEAGETPRQAAVRELYEETHQTQAELDFKGLFRVRDAKGTVKYQAVFAGSLTALAPFVPRADDEMESIRLWDGKEDIGYIDECDLKIAEMVLE